MPAAASSPISASSVSGFTTVPGPTMHFVAGLKMPEGTMWSRNVPCSLTTVWPALSPPWKRITMPARWAR